MGWLNPNSDQKIGLMCGSSSFDACDRKDIYLFSNVYRCALRPMQPLIQSHRGKKLGLWI